MNSLYSLVFLSFLLQTSFSILESFPWLSLSHETLPVMITLILLIIRPTIYPSHVAPYTGMDSEFYTTNSILSEF